MDYSIFKSIQSIGIFQFGLIILYLLNPFDKGFIIGYLLFVITYFDGKFLIKSIDQTFLILLIFSLVYAAFYFLDMNQGIQWLIIYATFPHVFYLLGKRISNYVENENVLTHLLIFFGIIYSLTAIISVGMNIIQGGFIQIERTIPDFWTGKERLATAMGSYFVFNMSIPGLLIVAKRKLSPILKILLILIFFISLLCVFRLGSRTQIVIAIIGILVGIVYRWLSQDIFSNFKFLIVLLILIVLGLNYISIDLDTEYLSTLGQRIQESENAESAGGRTDLWIRSIENLMEKPLGWSLDEFGYSHNLWLDTARTGSVISFILICVFTIDSFNNILKSIKVDRLAHFFKATVVLFSIIMFLQFFVEPVFDSPLFLLFIFFCIFQGCINGHTQKIKGLC